MANSHTKASAKGDGKELTVSSTTTDCPILPIEQIERLQKIVPHRVEWVFEQTNAESEYRRTENRRVNTLVFIERTAGLLFALIVALSGLAAAAYCASLGREVTASVLGGTTLVGMVTAFIVAKKN
jgi:hypothetical protein